MLVEVKKEAGWYCRCNPRQVDWVQQLPEIPALLQACKELPITLKDNHRSVVKQGKLADKFIVSKQPKDKNRRRWARILSYFEPSEVAQTLLTLERFHEAGIESVQPLFVLEKRILGAVVDSWICYEYREGQACTGDRLDDIINMLTKIHRAGFRHNDPNLGNFLIDRNDTMFVLDCRGRKRSGNFSDANDFFLLKKINKSLVNFELSDIPHLDQSSFGYRLAAAYSRAKSLRSTLKDKFRKNRLKNNEN